MSKKVFHLVNFNSNDGSTTFSVPLLIEASTVERAAATLGCGIVATPCLPSPIVQTMIRAAMGKKSGCHQLLAGRPSILALVRTSIDLVDGDTLLKIQEAARLFLVDIDPIAA